MENARVCICLLRKGNGMPSGWPQSISTSSLQLVSLLFHIPKHLQLLHCILQVPCNLFTHIVDPNRIPATAKLQTLPITPESHSPSVLALMQMCCPGHVSAARHFSEKQCSDHIFCCAAGPERSGSTWLFNAVRLILKHAHIPYDPYWITTLTTDKLQQRKVTPQHNFLAAEMLIDCSLSLRRRLYALQQDCCATAYRQGNSRQSYNAQLTMMQCVPTPHSPIVIISIINNNISITIDHA